MPDDKATWMEQVLGVRMGAGSAQAAGTAGVVAPPRVSAAGPSTVASPSTAKTGTVRTPFGDFVYLAAVTNVEPVVSEVVDEYQAALDMSVDFVRDVNALESLESKYEDVDMRDILPEINRTTDRTLKDEAGAARGAAVVDEGFTVALEQFLSDVGTAKDNVKFAESDLKVENMRDAAAAARKIGKELQEGPFEALSKIVEVANHVHEVITAPEEPWKWASVAADGLSAIGGILGSQENEFLKRANELEKEANRLVGSTLAGKISTAKIALYNAKKTVEKMTSIVQKAGKDVGTKIDTRDNNYDKAAKAKKGKFLFEEMRKGMELAKRVREQAPQIYAKAHGAEMLLIGLEKLHGEPATWMAKPSDGKRILYELMKACKELVANSLPKIAWSKTVAQKFAKLYQEAGDAMADASGTPH
jgi:hypothetical protein